MAPCSAMYVIIHYYNSNRYELETFQSLPGSRTVHTTWRSFPGPDTAIKIGKTHRISKVERVYRWFHKVWIYGFVQTPVDCKNIFISVSDTLVSYHGQHNYLCRPQSDPVLPSHSWIYGSCCKCTCFRYRVCSCRCCYDGSDGCINLDDPFLSSSSSTIAAYHRNGIVSSCQLMSLLHTIDLNAEYNLCRSRATLAYDTEHEDNQLG